MKGGKAERKKKKYHRIKFLLLFLCFGEKSWKKEPFATYKGPPVPSAPQTSRSQPSSREERKRGKGGGGGGGGREAPRSNPERRFFLVVFLTAGDGATAADNLTHAEPGVHLGGEERSSPHLRVGRRECVCGSDVMSDCRG